MLPNQMRVAILNPKQYLFKEMERFGSRQAFSLNKIVKKLSALNMFKNQKSVSL